MRFRHGQERLPGQIAFMQQAVPASELSRNDLVPAPAP